MTPAYPHFLSTNALRLLNGLGNPPLPEAGHSVEITEHAFHPAQTYAVTVNHFGDVAITSTTRNEFGFAHASGYSVNRNPDVGGDL